MTNLNVSKSLTVSVSRDPTCASGNATPCPVLVIKSSMDGGRIASHNFNRDAYRLRRYHPITGAPVAVSDHRAHPRTGVYVARLTPPFRGHGFAQNRARWCKSFCRPFRQLVSGRLKGTNNELHGNSRPWESSRSTSIRLRQLIRNNAPDDCRDDQCMGPVRERFPVHLGAYSDGRQGSQKRVFLTSL